MTAWEKSKLFIFRNARPLDVARWNCLFENGDKNEVVKYLKCYQNSDGGFANALEPDCWNTESTPMQTWAATKILKEIGFDDKKHDIVKGILQYLSSEDNFNGSFWNGLNTVKSNNNYPHAQWWSYSKEKETCYNPTASLAGFIIKYADNTSDLYSLACKLTKEAYNYLKLNYPLSSMHETACFVELYEYLKESHVENLLDLTEFKNLLLQQITTVITYDTHCWSEEYICKPSLFFNNKYSDFYQYNKDICNFECEFIYNTQNDDGTWNVTWSWDNYAEEWSISKNWWKADIIIKNISFIKEFSDKTF